MARAKKYGIRELNREFPSDEACLTHLFLASHTIKCSCGGRYALITGRKQFQCSRCRFQIAPMAGTIFEKSKTPLMVWFHALQAFSNAKSGISAKELERQLNVTYKCAYRILKQIRSCLKQSEKKLKGVVELDDGYFGGKRYGGRYNKHYAENMEKKTKVIAAIERGGIIVAKMVKSVNLPALEAFLNRHVDSKDTELMTDSSSRFKNVMKGYNHASVLHKGGQWVQGTVHVNTVESFWSHVKRSMKGTFKSVSKAQFQSYLNAFVWLRNNRHNDRLRFEALLDAVVR